MKIHFIIFYKNENCLNKCLGCINSLNIPDGVEIDTLGTAEGDSITEVYEACRLESDADIKIYIRENTYIVDADFLYRLTDYFNGNPDIYVAGAVGGIAGDSFAEWTGGCLSIINDDRQTVFAKESAEDINCILGNIIISRADISWDNISDDNFDIEYSLRAVAKGYKTGIFSPGTQWCLLEYGMAFRERRDIFLEDGRAWAYISKDKPLVSVVVPMHNSGPMIRDNIESIINQTYLNQEIIMVDDYSTDNTCDILKEYMATDSRIELISLDTNNHVCYAVNEGYIRTTGKYVALMGHDDMWTAGKIEEQVAFLEHEKKCAACFTYVHVIDENMNVIDAESAVYKLFRQPNRSSAEWLETLLVKGNCLCAPSVMLRKSMMRKQLYRLYTVQLQDYELWMDMLIDNEIFILPEALTLYRQFVNEASNLSSVKKESSITPKEVRLYREANLIKYKLVMKIPDKQFAEIFRKHFKNIKSETHAEIMFEKAFLLYNLNSSHFTDIISELLTEDHNVDVFFNHFGMSLPDYYEMEKKFML